MIGVDPQTLALLCAVAGLAGCIDAIGGGGGLITVPALMLAGLDPVTAIATNKAQGAAGAMSSALAFARAKMVDWRAATPVALAAGAASILGALSVTHIDRRALEALAPVLLAVIALYFLFAPRLSDKDARARIGPALFAGTLAPLVGFYDGVFGPGAGSFYMIGFVGLLGFGILRATAHTKIANAASNLGSLGLYAATGAVVWPVGFAMALFAFLGAQVGARLAMRLGARLIRPLLVFVACAMALKLLADPANPLTAALGPLLAH
ncbi:MAG TPA: TSUP family transporter [Beijerinckiaceae bacterium]|nr:TSUP family transporter [Rhodoblastus sp.]HRY03070.1 TSUP family transporter [Beijerinckiaceae bacterium]